MLAYILPFLFALLVWWAGTGLVLFLDQLPARTYRWSMAAASALALAAMAGLAITSNDASVAGAYIGFACGVAVFDRFSLVRFSFSAGNRKLDFRLSISEIESGGHDGHATAVDGFFEGQDFLTVKQ